MSTLNKISELPLLKKWTIICPLFRHSFSNQTLILLAFFTSITACNNSDLSHRPSPYTSDTLNNNGRVMTIAYSSPRVRGRQIWDELVPHGKIWRTGANEATVFTTNVDMQIDGQLLPAGKYAIFTIPTAEEWIIIFNKDWDQWGAYSYDSSNDQMRIQVVPNRQKEFKEEMTFKVDHQSIQFYWKNLGYELPYKVLED